MDLMVLFQERVTFMVSCRISINPPPLTEDQQIILTSDYPTPKIGADKQPKLSDQVKDDVCQVCLYVILVLKNKGDVNKH